MLAENFRDWQAGYKSLSDFENDIAFLSSLVVIFLESEGALAEFGLFFANKTLREKLVVIIHEEFHKAESFIKYGLLNPLEDQDQESVRDYAIDHTDIENIDQREVADVLNDVLSQCDELHKTEKFNADHRGHQIFLIFQLIDLFHALTKQEILTYLEILNVRISNRALDSALYILQKFNLLEVEKKSSQYFYFVPRGLADRIDIHFSLQDGRRYDTATVKIQVNEFYHQQAKAENPGHKRRVKVIQPPTTGGDS